MGKSRFQNTHYAPKQALAFSKRLRQTERMLNVRQRRLAGDRVEVADLIADYGQSRTAILLKVHRSTVMRWVEGRSKAPEAVLIALRAAVRGHLPGMTVSHWEGWSFGRDGRLYEPGGRSHHAGDIMASQYERALIKALQNEVWELETRLNKALEESNGAANDPVLKLRQA